ncbi:hypothetical protein POF50_032340 [Streptomyces sp. SL13]|uniref:Uncharacterized protein n=1 Tax=Streptantibioticus silvisoli TaxID=2705255 RepID=A0AA90KJ08_9ACTN|nr:hypothetical protein [Streptantibioticus silvisoli]MDI5973980.1 hypothetical protein [Streptantibioticus silvisoli]
MPPKPATQPTTEDLADNNHNTNCDPQTIIRHPHGTPNRTRRQQSITATGRAPFATPPGQSLRLTAQRTTRPGYNPMPDITFHRPTPTDTLLPPISHTAVTTTSNTRPLHRNTVLHLRIYRSTPSTDPAPDVREEQLQLLGTGP